MADFTSDAFLPVIFVVILGLAWLANGSSGGKKG